MKNPVCPAKQPGSWLSGDARFGLACEVGDGRELAALKHPGHRSTAFWSKLCSRMAFSRPLLAQSPCAASLPATSMPAPQDIFSSAFSSTFCASLRVPAFRDSFPLRYAYGPLPSSGDEVSFYALMRVLPSETPPHCAALAGPLLPQETRSLSARPSRALPTASPCQIP